MATVSNSSLASSAAVLSLGASEQYTSRYTVVKSSWRGRYTRVFCISATGIATINPSSIFKITNAWDFATGFTEVTADPSQPTQFTIAVNKGGKADNLTFSTETEAERAELITDVQRCRAAFDRAFPALANRLQFSAGKITRDEEEQRVWLRVTAVGIDVSLDGSSVVSEYLFMHIKGMTSLVGLQDTTLILAYGPQMKLHCYKLPNATQLRQLIQQHATRYIGLPTYRAMNELSEEQFTSDRLGLRREVLEATAEFPCTKASARHGATPVKRVLGTTTVALIERDPTTYNVVGAYFLTSIYACVRSEERDQDFSIQFKEPHVTKHYRSPLRDTILAHIVEACHLAGNTNVSVLSRLVDRSKRYCSLRGVVSEEIESTLLRCLMDPSKTLTSSGACLSYPGVLAFFVANVEYSGLRQSENKDGLFAENREKLIFDALSALVQQGEAMIQAGPAATILFFQTMRRLSVTRVGFSAVAVVPSLVKEVGTLSVRALRMGQPHVALAVVEFLNSIMTPLHNHYEMEHESINKNRILSAAGFMHSLLVMTRDYIEREKSALVLAQLLQFFVYALCPPFCEVTDAGVFNALMNELVHVVGRSLFHVLAHPCAAVAVNAAQLIREVMEEGSEEQFTLMQRAALAQGGVLMVFNLAIWDKNRRLRDLSRRLLAYWTFENRDMQDLLRRMVPLTLLAFLQSPEEADSDEQEQVLRKGVTQMTPMQREAMSNGWFRKSFQPRAVVDSGKAASSAANAVATGADGGKSRTRVRDVRVQPKINWNMFFHQLKKDHFRPDLIWNHATRNELRQAVEAELKNFSAGAENHVKGAQSHTYAWNYQEFEVVYHSLDGELKIGQHYPRLLFEEREPVIARPGEFFNDLYHRFLLVDTPQSKLECLHGMTLLYQHYAESIGQFNDLPFLVRMLEATTDPCFRDRMLLFLAQVLKARHNVKLFIDADGLASLTDLLTLAQLHIDRPQIQAISNAIEYSGNSLEDLQGKEKEWYYSNANGGKAPEPVSYTALKSLVADGSVTAKTKVWAQGMPGWRPLQEVAQLRWGILYADRPSILTFTEVTCTVLDMLVTICRHYACVNEEGAVMYPVPRVKRYLTSPSLLPHIVQLLLTFDPSVCARVHGLLFELLRDNNSASRLYLTGYFFFTFMYTGSDMLSACRVLHLVHRQQAFRYPHSNNNIVRSSILGPLLPPAMICYLTHHGPEAFADVLLGEYDTPEAIWGKEMRRALAGKLATHVADFTPRLLANNTALYQYCPMVTVEYASLQHELFCSEYYLRHLCDESRFPDWPIRDPVLLLQDSLAVWQAELDRKPAAWTESTALAELGIGPRSVGEGPRNNGEDDADDRPSPASIRKAYFVLAAQYHPDKNPNGRDKFEAIQQAYEYLISANHFSAEPVARNILLVLRTQCILFKRRGEVMKDFKYPGYPLLLGLVRREEADAAMLTKDVPLIAPATELCFLTVRNAKLNADELQEEDGVALLARVATRCFDHLTPSTQEMGTRGDVAKHCMLTFAVGAQIADCRSKMEAEPVISYLVAKGAAYTQLLPLARACVQACQTCCESRIMQDALVKAGALWHMIGYLLRYDATLERAGVELNESRHTQLFVNKAAVFALKAVAALSGLVPEAGAGAYVASAPVPEVIEVLERLFTPYIVQKLKTQSHAEEEVLALLNGNSETPSFVWNNGTRTELKELASMYSDRCRDAPQGTDNSDTLTEARAFVYSAYARETIVGGIFLRVFLSQPSTPLAKPADFLCALVRFIYEQLASRKEKEDGAQQLLLAARALLQLVTAHGEAVHVTALDYLPTMVSFLSARQPQVNETIFGVLEQLLRFEDCLAAVAAVKTAMARVALALHRLADTPWSEKETHVSAALQFLLKALGSRLLVEQTVDRGLYVSLLVLFGTAPQPSLKELVCTVLARGVNDKLTGPKLLLQCEQFLPRVVLDAMSENAALACQMLDKWQETPELVWDKSEKARFITRVTACEENVAATLSGNLEATWRVPAEQLTTPPLDRIQIGGIYLAIYLKQPGWNVRKPREFLMALMNSFLAECEVVAAASDASRVALVVDSGLLLFRTTPNTRDYIATLGYERKLVELLSSRDAVISTHALRWLNAACDSPVCVEALAAMPMTGDIHPIQQLQRMLSTPQAPVALILDTMEKIFASSTVSATATLQGADNRALRAAMASELPQKLLSLLETGVAPGENGESPAAMRALVIKVLKSIASLHDPIHGSTLDALLAKSAVWAKYQTQNHDLFLANTGFGGYLTNSTAGNANGSSARGGATPAAPMIALEAAPNLNYSDEPPPLD